LTETGTGLVLRLSGVCFLDGGRRPEPQTRGETRLRSRNYFFLFSVLPFSRIHNGQSWNQFSYVIEIGQINERGIARWRELLQFRATDGGAMACRMANRQII